MDKPPSIADKMISGAVLVIVWSMWQPRHPYGLFSQVILLRVELDKLRLKVTISKRIMLLISATDNLSIVQCGILLSASILCNHKTLACGDFSWQGDVVGSPSMSMDNVVLQRRLLASRLYHYHPELVLVLLLFCFWE